MRERCVLWAALAVLLGLAGARVGISRAAAQSPTIDGNTIRVHVELVQMNIAVTDKKGNYVSGLEPEDFQIVEDGIVQQLASFEEGNRARRILLNQKGAASPKIAGAQPGVTLPLNLQSPPIAPPAVARAADQPAGDDALSNDPQGSSVFLLFDTSNYMYQDFSSAQDSMVNFVRSLDSIDRVAFYSYSRNLSRRVALTDNRLQVVRGVHNVAAGDDDALFSSMLLTLQDAGRSKGRRVLVVFSHGPDNESTISPEAVSELAQSEGLPIYIVGTGKAQLDPESRVVFERLASSTGGQAYFAGTDSVAGTKAEEQKAFAAIRADLASAYTLSYYPRYNPNQGWRTITVKLKDGQKKGYSVRTRSGYRPGVAGDVEDQSR